MNRERHLRVRASGNRRAVREGQRTFAEKSGDRPTVSVERQGMSEVVWRTERGFLQSPAQAGKTRGVGTNAVSMGP